MVLPGILTRQIPLVITGNVALAWLQSAMERAHGCNGIDVDMVIFGEDGSFRGWSLLQVCGFVAKTFGVQECPYASGGFIIADDKSEETDSLLLLYLDMRSFEEHPDTRRAIVEGKIRVAPELALEKASSYHDRLKGCGIRDDLDLLSSEDDILPKYPDVELDGAPLSAYRCLKL